MNYKVCSFKIVTI